MNDTLAVVSEDQAGPLCPSGASPPQGGREALHPSSLPPCGGDVAQRQRGNLFSRLRRPEKRIAAALAILMIAGIGLVGHGTYMKAKAALSQVLLERAFGERLAGDAGARPWPWADFTLTARIEAPRLGKTAIVLSGASGEAMAFGPAHLTNTPLPGAEGTAVIAAHRDSHFAWLKDVRAGDLIRVTDASGRTLDFRVSRGRIARWNDSGINAAAYGKHLALVTCWPFDAKLRGDMRYIVEAELADTPTPQRLARL